MSKKIEYSSCNTFKWQYLLFIAILAYSFFSCSPEKYLANGEYLLEKNKVIVQEGKNIDVASDLVYAVRPKINKKTFGIFPWSVGIYQQMQRKIDNDQLSSLQKKLRATLGKYPVILDTATNDYYRQKKQNIYLWIQTNFGEEPVLLDTSMLSYSMAQIRLMMFNNGYFNSVVTNEVKYKWKKAKVYYYVKAGDPYRINDINYEIPDSNIYNLVLRDTLRRYIHRGDIYSVDIFTQEQERIVTTMQNRGYYFFDKNYIHYKIDTNIGNHLLNVQIIIDNPKYQLEDSSIVVGKHRKYKINTISIFEGVSNMADISNVKTIKYREIVRKIDTNEYTIYYNHTKSYLPKSIVYPLRFKKGMLYSSRRSQLTYDRYSDMRNFDFIKILYAETPESKKDYMSDTGSLDCRIQLIRGKKRTMGFDALLKNTGSRIGIGGSLTLMNRNVFKGAEILSFTLKYTHELQNDSSRFRFRNFELGGTLGLEIPRFLFPIKQQNISKSFRIKTLIQLTANYMRQDYYDRFLTNIGFTYKLGRRVGKNRAWRIDHSISVVDLSIIKMYPAPDFEEAVARYHFTRRILEKYKDHFILGSNYEFILQNANKMVLKTNIDWYGNILYGIMNALGKHTSKQLNEYGQYVIWKIPFASGITADVDIVYNIFRTKKQMMVFHAAAGLGIPILNSQSLPFEKSFYLGGSNSMRAWRLRTLGPGGYIDTSASTFVIENVGDIKLELNLEYRFKIYKVLNAALFVDAGNVWLLRSNKEFPNGEFVFNRFYKEIAIDAGIGIRLDLSFFVFRLDYALKIHNPALAGNQSWQHFNWKSYKDFRNDRAIVFGIGYPF